MIKFFKSLRTDIKNHKNKRIPREGIHKKHSVVDFIYNKTGLDLGDI